MMAPLVKRVYILEDDHTSNKEPHMAVGHVQVGFDLRTTKSYSSPEAAERAVRACMLNFTEVMFNILVVAQRRGGMGTDAEDLRYVPLLNCFRTSSNSTGTDNAAMVHAVRNGFTCFR